MAWPPESREAMRALQDKYGSDTGIARAVGVVQATVSAHRRRLGLSVRPTKYVHVQPTRARTLSEAAITDIYDDRTYQDVALR